MCVHGMCVHGMCVHGMCVHGIINGSSTEKDVVCVHGIINGFPTLIVFLHNTGIYSLKSNHRVRAVFE